MKQADPYSNQAGTCFKVDRRLLQNRRIYVSKQAGACFKKHISSSFPKITKMVSSE